MERHRTARGRQIATAQATVRSDTLSAMTDEAGDSDDSISLSEAARRLGVEKSGLGRKVAAAGIPVVADRGRKLVSWAAVSARWSPLAGLVAFSDLNEQAGVGTDALAARCRARGIAVRRLATNAKERYVRDEDAAAVLAPSVPVRPTTGRGEKHCKTCGEIRPIG